MTGALLFFIFGWLFHISLVFFKIVFPILALRIQKYFKYIHVFLLCIGKSILIETLRALCKHTVQVYTIRTNINMVYS